jgi:hypothetical protein
MSAKIALGNLLETLPENRLQQLLDYARFLSLQEEHEAWQRFGEAELARAYGPDEPEYTEADILPESDP